MKILIVVDHLRIGGIERLALDQAYELYDRGVDFALINLNLDLTIQNPNFLFQSGESTLIERLRIINAPKGLVRQLTFVLRILITKKPKLIISHSLRASVMFFVWKILRTGIHINTTIHQLPSLSDRKQRIKRYIYSQFSDSLFAYSEAVRLDWNQNITKSRWLRFICRKEIKILRNGIYLDRLVQRDKVVNPRFPIQSSTLRIIFIGRAVGWKGLDKLREISKVVPLSTRFLIFVPSISSEAASHLKVEFGDRLQLTVGSTLSNFQSQLGDIHVYPVNYGKNCPFIESISLNCLEMAALGVPSLVTKGGIETWPELVRLGAFHEQDWDDLTNLSRATYFSNLKEISGISIKRIWELIDVKNNLQIHLAEANISLGKHMQDSPHTH